MLAWALNTPMLAWALNTPQLLKNLQTFDFFEVLYIIRLLKSAT